MADSAGVAKLVGMSKDTTEPERATMVDEAQGDEGEPWHVYSRPVFKFALVLRDADDMPFDEDEYWEKPWHWEPVHQLWIDAGSPHCPGAGNPPSLAWERFLRGVAEYRSDDD